MTDVILVFDPGEATGWSLWLLDDDAPMQRVEFGVIPGGVDGFLDWIETRLGSLRPTIICERYDPLRGGRFKNYTAMYIEGALRAVCRALALEIIWQDPDMKTLCSDECLKTNGLWIENDEVEWEDARDANDTQRHALGWGKTIDHEPTVEFYWPER